MISARACADELVAGDVELHIVHALAAADPDRLADLVDAVGDHAKTFRVHVRLALVAEAAGDRDLRAGGAVARAGEIAVRDLLPHDHVDAQLGRGGGIAAGEAVVEDEGGVAAGAKQMLFRRDFAEILVARRADEGEVAMALDHAGHQELPLRVDRLRRALAADRVLAARQRLDAVPFHHHLARIGGVVDAVPDGDVPEEI